MLLLLLLLLLLLQLLPTTTTAIEMKVMLNNPSGFTQSNYTDAATQIATAVQETNSRIAFNSAMLSGSEVTISLTISGASGDSTSDLSIYREIRRQLTAPVSVLKSIDLFSTPQTVPVTRQCPGSSDKADCTQYEEDNGAFWVMTSALVLGIYAAAWIVVFCCYYNKVWKPKMVAKNEETARLAREEAMAEYRRSMTSSLAADTSAPKKVVSDAKKH
jgi:hypothetical protein